MLAGMKYRVAELTGEHRYRGLGFIPAMRYGRRPSRRYRSK